MKNILEEANDIVYKRSEEKQRQYGDFADGMRSTAIMASEMCGIELSASDVCKVLIALKLSRQAFSHKKDNILDSLAYMAMLYELEEGK